MTILLTVVHVIVAMFLIVVVLLQTGKRADLAGAFGGGGSQTAFGARGAVSILSKATTLAAVLFMVTSMSLAVLSSRSGSSGGGSVLDQVAPATTEEPADSGNQLPALPPADPIVDDATGDDATGEPESNDSGDLDPPSTDPAAADESTEPDENP